MVGRSGAGVLRRDGRRRQTSCNGSRRAHCETCFIEVRGRRIVATTPALSKKCCHGEGRIAAALRSVRTALRLWKLPRNVLFQPLWNVAGARRARNRLFKRAAGIEEFTLKQRIVVTWRWLPLR